VDEIRDEVLSFLLEQPGAGGVVLPTVIPLANDAFLAFNTEQKTDQAVDTREETESQSSKAPVETPQKEESKQQQESSSPESDEKQPTNVILPQPTGDDYDDPRP